MKVERPWGWYEVIDEGDRYKIKNIEVNPGERLSLQYHYHRSEHWVVVTGTAFVHVGDIEKLLYQNESIYVPPIVKHRLSNPGRVPLRIVEVQCGTYLEEDDIIRLDDEYNRCQDSPITNLIMDYKPYSPEWHRKRYLKEALDKYFDDYVDVETIREDIYDILHARASDAFEEYNRVNKLAESLS